MDLYEACICYFLCNMDPSILLLSTDFDLYENWELPGVQDGFRKGSRIRDQIANICWIIKKEREFQKNIYSALLTMPKPLTVWITTNCERLFERWEYQTTLPAFWEICMQVNNS